MNPRAVLALAPIVFFPGYGTTVLHVTVTNQTAVAGCPASGMFDDWVGAAPGGAYDQSCRDRLLTPRSRGGHIGRQPGVRVTIPGYGSTATAPVYTQLFDRLDRAGYTAGKDLLVAGYDFRLTPDLGGFLRRTVRLVERTAARNGGRPVRLVGHSNGPLYAQYLLTHRSAAWKRRYIQGFTNIAGNLPGQGAAWTMVFVGTPTSARLNALSPATWMSAPDPAVFGDRETLVEDRSTGRRYTPRDTTALLRDAKLGFARSLAERYIGFVKFRDRRHFPDVDVTAEKGSGLSTPVGVSLPSLELGQDASTSTPITLPGDSNQEFITNDAVRAWRAMPCHRFRLIDNPGVDHITLAWNDGVVARLLADAARAPKRCPSG